MIMYEAIQTIVDSILHERSFDAWCNGATRGVTVSMSAFLDRLVGLVVKASTTRAEGPEFESRSRRDFFGVESYQ